MSTLQELNALRTAVGMKPLKAWKESKAKLDTAVAKLAGNATTEQQLKASVKSDVGTKSGANSEARKPKKAEGKKAKVEGISVSTIAAELDIDPKVARAKLRRAFGDADGTGSNGRWVFTEAKAKEVRAILKGDSRKKA